MKKLLIPLIFLISNLSYSQVSLHLPAVYQDSNYLGIRIGEKMATNNSPSNFTFFNKDTSCVVKSYYCNISIKPGETLRREVNVLFCRKGETYAVTVDLNYNKNFNDDSTVILYNNQTNNKYHFVVNFDQVSGQRHNVLYLTLELYDILTTEPNGKSYNETFLDITHKQSILASFTLGNSIYKIEAVPKYLNNGIGEANIGLSEPDSEIKKMNIPRSIFPHRLRNDTIISGKYKFIVDSVDFTKNIISLTSWPMTDKDYGYNISNRIRNYSLPYLHDTSKIISINSLFMDSNYLLIDFWGSWCSPCIKSIPKVEELDAKSQKLNLKVIGIACERQDDLSAPLRIAQKLNVKYDNFFINTNHKTGQEIINNLDMLTFPTYILLDKNLKIIMRETTEEGLKKIEEFLEKPYK